MPGRPRRHHLAALLGGVVIACGGGTTTVPGTQSPAAPPATATSATPTPKAGGRLEDVLFAVLEPGTELRPNIAVAIVGIDGVARAKATFAPRSLPRIGNAAVIPQPEAHTAAGAAFYIDGQGVVRRLGLDNSAPQVATFPLTDPQQLAAFAVSPDGKKLIASVLSLPPWLPDPPPFGSFKSKAPAILTIQLAAAGGSTRTLLTQDLGPADSGQFLKTGSVVVGWDRTGPVALVDGALHGTQQPPQGYQRLGVRGHLDEASGSPAGTPVGGPGCVSWDQAAGGSVGCGVFAGSAISIRSPEGTVLYEFTAGNGVFTYPALSPDGSRTAVYQVGNDSGYTSVYSKAGSQRLPVPFIPEGWLDDVTLVGHALKAGSPDGNLAYLRLSAPDKIQDMGFKGTFAGMIRPAQ